MKFQTSRPSPYPPQIRQNFELARNLQSITLPLVWQPFLPEAPAEVARATVPTGKAMP